MLEMTGHTIFRFDGERQRVRVPVPHSVSEDLFAFRSSHSCDRHDPRKLIE